ncbi:MAG: sulfatase [Akkermansiaceae bacterium]
MPQRFPLLPLGLIILMSFPGIGMGGIRTKNQANFLIILTDDQGYADLSCFGSKTVKTPHLDRLAKEGRKFTNFAVPQSLCTPSRTALMTGCYPRRLGMHKWVFFPQDTEGLNPAEHTIADHLKAQGYATGAFGKWHLGHHPETLPHAHRFDHYFRIPYTNHMNHPDNKGKPKQGLAGYDALWADRESSLTQWKTPLIEGTKIIELPVDQRTVTRRYTDRTIDFIKKNKNQPFFAYLPHTMPHVPIYVPDDLYDPDPKTAYIKVIEQIDSEVGRIMDTLRELKIEENTYVIFTSDNGPALNLKHHGGNAGPLRGGKISTFEGGTRVPLIIRGPGIPANTECDEFMSILDLLPTIAALTKTPLPTKNKIDGLDVSTLLTNPTAKSPRSEMLYFDGHGKLEGLRQNDWKLLVKKKTTFLFNLANDLSEKNNLAETHSDRVRKMTARMKELGAELDSNQRPPWEKDP